MDYAEHPRPMLQLLESRLMKCSSLIDLPLMLPKERKNVNLKWSDYETEYDFAYRPDLNRI
ncbi:hypothetical protein BVRB_019990 [Beta vulgaris subsp. vulgaris]|uniref:Uncharacterized protein n=1 Tax=Beta vulgaris subsp. vulgaris TaxID=3555 RepID=A0A0J8B0R4_BETVV|nr:hypothetical protein BVRB_019990 [Beta vulgaris subsp. vulgaris]